jgi:hypothetical protein
MKVAFTMDETLLCGGTIIPAMYVTELRKRGYEASIYAKRPTNSLDYFTRNIVPYSELTNFTDNDVIINVWWMTGTEDDTFKGRKFQLVQGNDLFGDIGDDYKRNNIAFRSNPNWEIIAVSKYSGDWTNRKYTLIPNGIHERFFINHNLERDIDALIEGNNDYKKGVKQAIQKAKDDGHKKILWFGSRTIPTQGVETISSPHQDEIPKLYQRAKHFYKYSQSEGFCLPLLEAMASGCIIHSHDMGGNDFWHEGMTVEEGYEVAKQFDFNKSVDKLIETITK